ncbi:YcxB family protein [Sporolactobacillus sp. STSJ-5]|uniref:YcxB family protein n=1 Tax=Sporolactobacillus sp. STSJ-5 TaxID=2965076 RepID=UPI00351D4A9E
MGSTLDFVSAYEHKDMFRIHVSKNQAVVLPKQFFKNVDEINDFRRLISTLMPEKKVHLSKQ